MPDGGCLIEHQVHIFQCLLHSAFRGKIAAHHFRPLGLHHLRIGGRPASHIEKPGGVETKPLGKDQALGQCETIEAKDQIDGELGAASIADLAHVETSYEQRVEHIFHFVRDRRVPSDQRNTVATTHLIAGAGYGHVEVADAARTDTICERGHPIRVAGAHAQDDLSRSPTECGQKRVLDNILDLIGVEDRKNDAARGLGEIRDGRRGTPADVCKPSGARRIDVDPGDRNSGLDKPLGVDLTHQPQSDNTDRSASCALRHARIPNKVRVPCDRAAQAGAIGPRCGLSA